MESELGEGGVVEKGAWIRKPELVAGSPKSWLSLYPPNPTPKVCPQFAFRKLAEPTKRRRSRFSAGKFVRMAPPDPPASPFGLGIPQASGSGTHQTSPNKTSPNRPRDPIFQGR